MLVWLFNWIIDIFCGLCKLIGLIGERDECANNVKRLVVVTGADSGFGLLTTLELARLDDRYHVLATCLTVDGTTRLKDMKNVTPIQMDIRSESDIDTVIECYSSLLDKSKPRLVPWALVNNAGVAGM
jgi:NAD(P)-dependent dehydrogenase (short-subunit alcohol dehydrogenase family)